MATATTVKSVPALTKYIGSIVVNSIRLSSGPGEAYSNISKSFDFCASPNQCHFSWLIYDPVAISIVTFADTASKGISALSVLPSGKEGRVLWLDQDSTPAIVTVQPMLASEARISWNQDLQVTREYVEVGAWGRYWSIIESGRPTWEVFEVAGTAQTNAPSLPPFWCVRKSCESVGSWIWCISRFSRSRKGEIWCQAMSFSRGCIVATTCRWEVISNCPEILRCRFVMLVVGPDESFASSRMRRLM